MAWTEEEKQAELKRVTKISGFCVGDLNQEHPVWEH